MQFTTAQVRSAIGLPLQTLRYWRGILTPLRDKPAGKSARFSVGEILALFVVGKLVTGMRIDVGAIAPIAPAIFDLCRRPAFLGPNTVLHIDIEARTAALDRDWKLDARSQNGVILLPLYEIAMEIRNLLTAHDEIEPAQGEFPWPLTSVR